MPDENRLPDDAQEKIRNIMANQFLWAWMILAGMLDENGEIIEINPTPEPNRQCEHFHEYSDMNATIPFCDLEGHGCKCAECSLSAMPHKTTEFCKFIKSRMEDRDGGKT